MKKITANRCDLRCFVQVALGVVALFCTAAMGAEEARYYSPEGLSVSRNGKLIYVAEAGAKQVAVVDLAQGKVVKTYPLPQEPSGMALAAVGNVLFVTAGGADGHVVLLDLGSGKITASIAVGHTPMAPVLSPDGKTLYICNRFNNDVSALDVVSGHEVAKIPVEREPVAAAITPDGKTLLVANLLPNGVANGDYVGAAISMIDVESKQAVKIPLANGSSSVRGICVSPDGRFGYAVHSVAHFQQPTIKVERGWMNVAALSIIDIAARKIVNTVLLDEEELGAANPWAVACDKGGKFLCVTHAGTHEISVIDRAALTTKLERVARGEKGLVAAANVPTDFSFLAGIRRRVKLAGNGPRGLVLLGGKAVVAEYYSDSLGSVSIFPEKKAATTSIPLGPKTPLSVVRRGEMLFNDATLCRQQWQSCASCHPDARADGLNWDLLNDGVGNSKNAKSLLLAHKTPPSMWLGVRESAEKAVRAGIRYIQFSERPEEDAVAIDEYLKSLNPVPSPHLVNGKLNESAERGEKIFGQAGCIECHSSPLFSNNRLYNLGFGSGMDKDKPFAVPTLIEVWRTAPYLHDGRAATLEAVVTEHNKEGLHGNTANLSPQEVADLVEYMKSL